MQTQDIEQYMTYRKTKISIGSGQTHSGEGRNIGSITIKAFSFSTIKSVIIICLETISKHKKMSNNTSIDTGSNVHLMPLSIFSYLFPNTTEEQFPK